MLFMAGIFTNGLEESHKMIFNYGRFLIRFPPRGQRRIFISFNTFFPVALCLGDGDGWRGRKPGAKGLMMEEAAVATAGK